MEIEIEMEKEKGSVPEAGGPEIAFFDVETTVPRSGSSYALLEFGAVLVCPRRLVEVGSYSTLIRPGDLAAISANSVRCNGITRDAVASAPSFVDVADVVFTILHGRVWAGHNIVRFDCARIREAFAEIGRAAPEPKGMIDTLPLLTQRFGRRAGDMKMASLANYFGLGKQKHRSLDDVRMNLEVLKYCATVLFLESSLQDVLPMNTLVYDSTVARKQDNGNASHNEREAEVDPLSNQKKISFIGNTRMLDADDPSELVVHIEEMKLDPLREDATMHGQSPPNSPDMLCATSAPSEGSSGFAGFLEPDEVSTHCISAPIAPFYQSGHKIFIHHKDCPLQLCCMGLRIHFGISTRFQDNSGRPKLNIVVDIPENLYKVLDVCDHIAQKSSQESGSTSQWRSAVRKNGHSNPPSIRLHIPTVANSDAGIYSTEIYKKEPTGNTQKLVFSKFDAAELESLFSPGKFVDAFFYIDVYDYQQYAGLRLVAKRLVLHSK
ncbi:protein NEN1 [Typha angustifolia]|uniref:protein NEN1 n=1 Tax=Typha angustifolia TaxID=59011 RepID=UPI003C3084CC